MATIAEIQTAPPLFSEEQLARQRRWVLGITNLSHAFNHMNSGMMSVLYAVMMAPLGFGYAELGVIQAVNSVIGQGLQAGYGFITPFVKRSLILGTGNTLLGLSTVFMSGASSFNQLVALRAIGGAGTSPQHVVGASILSSWFPAARGKALAFHTTAGNVGTVIGPLLVVALLRFMDWRLVLVLIGIPSIIAGLSYFLLRDVVTPAPTTRKARARAGWSAYVACLKNRDLLLVSALFMVGAAGREGGINQLYLVPHFANDLELDLVVAGSLLTIVQVGGLVAPMIWGYLSDTFPRKFVMQSALIATAVTTVWLGSQQALDILLFANLGIYGLVSNSRQAITQAMVGDYAGDDLQDAAFSLYYTMGLISGPFWALVMGAIMQTQGFEIAMRVISVSFILGMLILIPLRIKPKAPRADSGVVAAS